MKKLELKDFKTVDIIILVYCVLMLLINNIWGGKLEKHSLINVVYWGSIVFALIIVYIRKVNRLKFASFFIALSPLALLVGFYEVAGFQIHTFFDYFFDGPIIIFENALFGIHPTIWFQQFDHPLFTEWMMFGYTTYLLLLPITAGALFIKHKYAESEHLVLSLMITFFMCYIGFILLPVEGPRFAMQSQYTIVFHGYLFKAIADLIEKNAMLHGGCIPSAHCAAATVMFILSYKYDRKLFYWIAPIIITLYVSTVYGRYHYPIDVFAGVVTGILGIKISYPLQKWWRNFSGITRKEIISRKNTLIPENVDVRTDQD
jgi:membrane-associated phospholipid phosphatase